MIGMDRPRDAGTAVRQAEPFLRSLAAGWGGVPLEFDDLLQHARIGVWRAWQAHNPARGPWRPYAMRGARAEVINAIRVATAQKRRADVQDVRLDAPVTEGGSPLSEVIPGGQDPADAIGSVTGEVAAWSRRRPPVKAQRPRRGAAGVRLVTAPTVVEARVIIGALVGVGPQELEAMTGVRAKAMGNARHRALGKLRAVLAA